MYKGYNLHIPDLTVFDSFLSKGKTLYKNGKSQVRQELDQVFAGDGIISVSKVKKNWFNPLKANVFISHSHSNSDMAIGMAGWLSSQFEISSFIDSCVWGYFSDLQRKIDDKFCKNDNGTYEYNSSNRVASHVNTILNNSLMRMIDQCECVIFINTPQSISSKGSAKNEESTYSPWIYSELETTRIIRRRPPERPELLKKAMELIAEAMNFSSPNFEYDDIDLSHLIKLNFDNIVDWHNCGKTELCALDYLYSNFE